MNKNIQYLLLGLLVAVGVADVKAGDEFQVWLSGSVKTDLTPTWSMKAYSESWFVEDASTHRLFNLDVGVTHKTTDYLRLGINVRQQVVRGNSQWLNENRLHGHASLLWSWRGLSLVDRNRLEVRFREGRDDIVRYRNRLKAEWSTFTEDGRVKPYVFNEVFIDSDQAAYNQNRLALGLKTRMGSSMSISPYYLLLSADVGGWNHAHVLGVHASATF